MWWCILLHVSTPFAPIEGGGGLIVEGAQCCFLCDRREPKKDALPTEFSSTPSAPNVDHSPSRNLHKPNTQAITIPQSRNKTRLLQPVNVTSLHLFRKLKPCLRWHFNGIILDFLQEGLVLLEGVAPLVFYSPLSMLSKWSMMFSPIRLNSFHCH